jgi:hypothetical protein
MKKLCVLVFCMGLFVVLYGQTESKVPARSFAVAMGPNWGKAIRYGLLDDDILIRTGYSLEMDYFQSLTPRWEAKISARYHRLRFAEITYTPQFDTIGGAFIFVSAGDKIVSYQNDAIGFTAGFRRLGKPAKIRWYWNGEAGATVFIQNAKVPAFTVGLGMGWEWTAPKKDWAVFAQPVLRGLFWSSEAAFGDHLMLTLEFGLHHALGKTNGIKTL